MQQQQMPLEQEPETIVIETLDQFVRALTAWHTNKTNMIKHMVNIPEGTEVTFEDGTTLILSGDALKGFQLGLRFALSEVGELPFAAEIEFTDSAPIITDPEAKVH